MSEVMETAGGFRSAIQDLLVPELKATQVEIRGVKETLDRHERWLERLNQNLSQSNQQNAERFETLSTNFNERFETLNTNFNERFERMGEDFHERVETLNKGFTERFETMSKDFYGRFEGLSKSFNERFEMLTKDHAEKFAAIMELIRDLQKNLAVVITRLDYGERISKLEAQVGRRTKSGKSKRGRLSL